ncbi:MAG: acyl-CoA thioesterase [Roseivirga sp.]
MPQDNPQIFEKTLKVSKTDLDAMNHVNNVRYLQWVQDVAEAHWQKVANPEWLENYAWVVINHFVEYKKPALLDYNILITTHVHDNTGPKSQRLVRIFNADTKELLCQASTWWCLLDGTSKRPMRVTEEIIEAFS